jgi:predicted O-methyltransferase YrrM
MKRRWHTIIERTPKTRKTIGVELGVLRGKTSCQLLESLPKLTLYMVDRWKTYSREERKPVKKNKIPNAKQKYFDKAYKKTLKVVKPFGDRAIILKTDTVKAVEMISGKVDFVFVDARHDYKGIKQDVEAWLPKVKKGGWIIGHDYGNPKHPDVKKYVDEKFPDVEIDEDYVWAKQL